jgi:hypothetical protein
MAQSLEAKIVVLGSQGVGKTSLVCFITFEKWFYLCGSVQRKIVGGVTELLIVCIVGSTICQEPIYSREHD